jgi:hypothetical protein
VGRVPDRLACLIHERIAFVVQSAEDVKSCSRFSRPFGLGASNTQGDEQLMKSIGNVIGDDA